MIDIRKAQTRLAAKGYAVGAADGVLGPKTMTGLLAFTAARPMAALEPLGKAAATYLPRYGLMDTVARLANFLGQAAHESGGYRYLAEIWGPTPAQRKYEGRADLGNTQPGDGFKFKGRGLFQLTGRANYRQMEAILGLPLVEHPEIAERPDVAVQTACEFWKSRGLSELADSGMEDTITRRINGGVNGLDERRALTAKLKALLS